MATAAYSVPAPLDTVSLPHPHGVCAPVVDESDAADLPAVGQLSATMNGLYLRNGPNPRFGTHNSWLATEE